MNSAIKLLLNFGHYISFNGNVRISKNGSLYIVKNYLSCSDHFSTQDIDVSYRKIPSNN